MPMLKLSEKGKALPWTKVPNDLFDEFLPILKDTELRILLTLTRYTRGWRIPRNHAFLTYDLLSRRTGRKGAAIAKALRGLEEKGFIVRTLELSTERWTGQPNPYQKRPSKSIHNK